MSFYVYILRCGDGSYYTAHTDNLENRLLEHKIGKCAGYTSTRLPVTLVYYETFNSRDDAFIAERKIKGWSRKKKEALMQKNWDELVKLSNQK